MGKFITSFQNHNAYQQVIFNENNTPNISLCKSENEVHYKDNNYHNGHEYVEIGGMKWATMNLGANSVTDTGLYFQWGDTRGEIEIPEDNSDLKERNIYYNEGWSKYNNEDELITLEASDDAVTDSWGGNWRMPTESEYQALLELTNKEWTNDYQNSGVKGYIFIDKIDSSKALFFRINSKIDDNYRYGYYLSSSLGYDDYNEYKNCKMLYFTHINNADYIHTGDGGRDIFGTVRGIINE